MASPTKAEFEAVVAEQRREREKELDAEQRQQGRVIDELIKRMAYAEECWKPDGSITESYPDWLERKGIESTWIDPQ